MADISQIKLPNNTTYNLKDSKKTGIYYVKGTQTAATGAWTGNIDVPALYTGLTIMYYLPYDGSGNATLNLTLSDGTTTGAKNCYITTGRLSTHYGAGRNIIMTYYKAGDISIKGTATTDDRWICDAYYDTNTIGEYFGCVKAGPKGLSRYSLAMKIISDYEDNIFLWESVVLPNATTSTNKTVNTNSFYLMDNPVVIYQNGANYSSGAISARSSTFHTTQNIDTRYSFNVGTDWSAAGRSLYLVGTTSDNGITFKLNTTKWWDDKLPYNSEMPETGDPIVYIYIGQMANGYVCELNPVHMVNIYYPSEHRWTFYSSIYSIHSENAMSSYEANYVNGHSVEKNVPSNAVFTDNRRAFFGTCSTAAATATKVVTLTDTDGWELKAGTTIGVKFSATNTASNVTLNVNNSGAKSIYYNNAVYTSTSTTVCGYANRVIYYMYDGTNWVWMAYSVDTNSDTKVRQTLISDNTDRPLLLAYDNNASTTANRDNVCYRNNSVYANPSTGNLHAIKLNGTDISEYMTNSSFNGRFGYDTESNGYMPSLFIEKDATRVDDYYNLMQTTNANDATYWNYGYHPLWQNLSARQFNGIAMGGLRVFNSKALTNVCFSIPKTDSADIAITGLLFCRDAIFKFYISVSKDNNTASQNIQKFTTGSTTFNATIASGSITDPVLGNLWQFNIAFTSAWWTQAKYIITNYTGVSKNPAIYFSAVNSSGQVRWEYAHNYSDEE